MGIVRDFDLPYSIVITKSLTNLISIITIGIWFTYRRIKWELTKNSISE